MRADRALRPNPSLNKGVGGCFIVEVRVGKDGLHGVSPYDSTLPQRVGYVKYNIPIKLTPATESIGIGI